MARLSKDNSAYERDEDGNLPEKEVPLETLSEDEKERLGYDRNEQVTVKVKPPTRGKLDRMQREAEEQDGDDEDEVTEFDMMIISEHITDPDYGKDDYIQSLELVRALIAAIYSEATGISQDEVMGDSLDELMEEAEEEQFQE